MKFPASFRRLLHGAGFFSQNLIMSTQKKLDSFFKPVCMKRCTESTEASNCKKFITEDKSKFNEKIVNEDSKENSSQNGDEDVCSELHSFVDNFNVLDERIGQSWFKALKNEFNKSYFKKLNNYVLSERKKNVIYPSEDQIWSWTRQCSINDIKVVILGQDPYHNPGQAHGLCFSVPVGVTPPPSLNNIYKELAVDVDGFIIPKHGYLVGWARQGVLLLNAVLTVKKNSPNSHKDKGWEELTTAVIKYINHNGTGIVFLLWGAYAQKKADFVDKKKHCVLKAVHPSPLSASRGWFGCRHFSKCNEYLKEMGKKPIDWNHLPEK